MLFFGLWSPAFADSALPVNAISSQGSAFYQFIPIILIAVVCYFLLIKPQQAKIKQHAIMLDALRRGDKVVIANGILGTIHKISGDEDVVVEIANEVRVRVLKSSINHVVSKTAPVAVPSATKKSTTDENT